MSHFLDQFSLNSPYNNEEPIRNNNSPYISNSQACTPELKSHEVATSILESPDLFPPNYFLSRDFEGFSPLFGEGVSSNIEDLNLPVTEILNPLTSNRQACSPELKSAGVAADMLENQVFSSPDYDFLLDRDLAKSDECSSVFSGGEAFFSSFTNKDLIDLGVQEERKRKTSVEDKGPPAKRQCCKESEKQEIEEEDIVDEFINNQIVVSEEVHETSQTSQRMNREEREKLILDKVISNPFLTPESLHKALKNQEIKISIRKIKKTWRKYDLTELEKRIEKLRVYYRENPQMTLTSIQKEALKDLIKTPEGLKLIIRNVALQNPRLSAEGVLEELEKQDIAVTKHAIISTWIKYDLTTINKRVEALRKYYKSHPKVILTDVQKKALESSATKTPEELELIMHNIALQNPRLSVEGALEELKKQDIAVTKYAITNTWLKYDLNTANKRVEALRKFYKSHPEVILTDIQKTALEGPIKDLRAMTPISENMAVQRTFDSVSDGFLIGPMPALESTESQRDLTSSILAQSRESENSIGEGVNLQPIFLHSFIPPSSQAIISTIKSKQPLNGSLSDEKKDS